jgi:CheY-like chemotaxis protein
MHQPLVLAIEPDLRQAAIVKRIVREKALADVAVVDSPDAALAAIRTRVPDVLLISALLSPRDEDELIAHLRTLRDAEHLQTHTIPQLASSFGSEDAKPKGLLSAFRRKRTPEHAPSGCDPELFAEEIRTYLKHASDKKREVRETGPGGGISPVVASPASAKRPAAEPAAVTEPANSSSWESPFEWRPTQTRTQAMEPESYSSPAPAPASGSPIPDLEPFVPEPAFAIPEPEPSFVEPPTPISVVEPPVPISIVVPPEPIVEPEPVLASAPAISDWRSLIKDPEPVVADTVTAVAEFAREPEPAFTREPEPEFTTFGREPEPEFTREPDLVLVSHAPRVRYPLTMRTAKGWFFVEGQAFAKSDPDSELQSELKAVLAGLSVPAMIASVTYAEGCRIRRVRLSDDAA